MLDQGGTVDAVGKHKQRAQPYCHLQRRNKHTRKHGTVVRTSKHGKRGRPLCSRFVDRSNFLLSQRSCGICVSPAQPRSREPRKLSPSSATSKYSCMCALDELVLRAPQHGIRDAVPRKCENVGDLRHDDNPFAANPCQDDLRRACSESLSSRVDRFVDWASGISGDGAASRKYTTR